MTRKRLQASHAQKSTAFTPWTTGPSPKSYWSHYAALGDPGLVDAVRSLAAVALLQRGDHTAGGALRAGVAHGPELVVDDIRADLATRALDPLGDLVHLTADLQIGDVSIEQQPVDTVDLQADATVQHLVDVHSTCHARRDSA